MRFPLKTLRSFRVSLSIPSVQLIVNFRALTVLR
jgi:hypothetical protein